MDVIRLLTVHPALVHIPLGTVPVLLLAYAIGARRRSERWTFVGDVTLVVAALGTLVAASFGLVSFVALEWPGGLGLWRWLHLGVGLLATASLVTFAIVRLARRRTRPVASGGSAWAAVAISGIVLGTGWIGGEVLVFHAGVAVKAAGDGALAPPVPQRGAPTDLETAMHRIRESWARITTSVATMIVEEPSDRLFLQIARDAKDLQQHAGFVARQAETDEPRAEAIRSPRVVYARLDDESEHGAGADQHAPTADHPHAANADHHGMSSMARELVDHATRLEELARKQQLPELAATLGQTAALCAHCHVETRWNSATPP